MNVLTKLFTRGGRMTATAERTESALQARLAAVDAGIAAGEGDTLALLEEREELQRAVQAAALARQQRADKEYRARVTAQADELRARVNERLDELGDLVPRLLLACSAFNTLVAEVQEKGLGFTPGAALLEDVFGIPVDFGSRLIAAIHACAPATEWDFGHLGMHGTGVKAARPKPRGPLPLRVPRFYNGPPPGYNGLWDPIKGEPIALEDTT